MGCVLGSAWIGDMLLAALVCVVATLIGYWYGLRDGREAADNAAHAVIADAAKRMVEAGRSDVVMSDALKCVISWHRTYLLPWESQEFLLSVSDADGQLGDYRITVGKVGEGEGDSPG